MSLAPDTIIALARNDVNGVNIIPNASVEIKDITNTTHVDIFGSNANDGIGSEISQPTNVDDNGTLNFWVEPGYYMITVAGQAPYGKVVGGGGLDYFTEEVNDQLDDVLSGAVQGDITDFDPNFEYTLKTQWVASPPGSNMIYRPAPGALPIGGDGSAFDPNDWVLTNRDPLTFNTVADMVAGSTSNGGTITHISGVRYRTLGFYSANDGGGGEYILSAETPNGYDKIDLGSSITAELQFDPKNVNVLQFGAGPSDAENSTGAISRAIDATVENGTLRGSKASTFSFSSKIIDKAITIKNLNLNSRPDSSFGVLIVRSGGVTLKGCKIKVTTAHITSARCSCVVVDGVTGGVRLDGFAALGCEFIGGKDTDYVLPFLHGCLCMSGVDNVVVEDCVIRDSQKEGTMISSGDNCEFRNCRAYNTGFSGIGSTGGSGYAHVGLTITGCYVERSGASGITANSENSVVTNNRVYNTTNNNGINIGHPHATEQYAVNCTCTGNTVEYDENPGSVTNLAGIRINASFGSVISGNTINGGDHLLYGIHSDTASSVTIGVNSITGCSTGIRVSHDRDAVVDISPADVNVSGNTITSSFANGIVVAAGRFVNIDGNTINKFGRGGSSFSTGVLLDKGTFVASKMESVSVSNNTIADGGYGVRLDHVKFPADLVTIKGNNLSQITTEPFRSDGVAVINASDNTVGANPQINSVAWAAGSTSLVVTNANIDDIIGAPQIVIDGAWIYTDAVRVTSVGTGTATFTRESGGAAQTLTYRTI